jgi:hypothetical protein
MTNATEVFQPSMAGLATYCGSGSDYDGAPWQVGAWRVSTNGHLFIGERAPDGGNPLTDRMTRVQDRLAQYCENAIVGSVSGSFTALRAFAGDVYAPQAEVCESCHGSGRYGEDSPCEHCEHCGKFTRSECRTCEGDGMIGAELPHRYARVGGVPVNLAYLAYALAVVQPCERVSVGVLDGVGTSYGRVLAVDGDNWRIALMQIREDAAENLPQWIPA